MTRSEWYRSAISNLGFFNTLRLQLTKVTQRSRLVARAQSKFVRHSLLFRPRTSDLQVLHQVLVERQYSCFDDLADVGLVLDLGANVGYSSAYFLSRHPDCFVIAVEPDGDNFAILENNLMPYAGRYRAVRGAVWPEPTTLYFDAQTAHAGEEWGRRVGRDAPGATAPVDGIDIDSLVAMTDYESISILKMDVEGAEREIFARNFSNWLDRTENIAVEIHDAEGQAAFASAIAGRGFALSTSGELTVGHRTGSSDR
jgi:FkbM family methyltransferase